MESYGEKLKQVRIEKNYSLEQVAQETHISKRFIVAMEEENSSIFPAETYLMGFLRNYSDYLGLNADEIITLYKNIKIQEQPLPMDELLYSKSNSGSFLLIPAIIIGVAVLVFGGYFVFSYFTGLQETQIAEAENIEQENVTNDTEYTRQGEDFYFDGGVLTQPFRINDTINISFKNALYKITITDIAEKATILLPDKTIQLNLFDPYNIDVNKDSESDIELVLTDIDKIDNQQRVIMRITEIGTLAINIEQRLLAMQDEENIEDELITDDTNSTDEVAEDTENNTETPDETENTAPLFTESRNGQIVLNSSRIKTFTLNMSFTGNCFIRYSIDGNNRIEHFYQKNDPALVIDTARNSISLWISNAGAVEAVIDGTKLALGNQGQVTTKQIEWIKNTESGDYELTVISVE